MSDLINKKCIPCAMPAGRQEGGTQPLSHNAAHELLKETPGWALHEVAPSPVKGQKSPLQIEREFKFKNFQEAVEFVNRIAALAESEGHHPDIFIHSWNRVRLSLYTHAIGGLSENDFIMAAKINTL